MEKSYNIQNSLTHRLGVTVLCVTAFLLCSTHVFAWRDVSLEYMKVDNTAYNIDLSNKNVKWGIRTSVELNWSLLNIKESREYNTDGCEECHVNAVNMHWYFKNDDTDAQTSTANYNLPWNKDTETQNCYYKKDWKCTPEIKEMIPASITPGDYTMHLWFDGTTDKGSCGSFTFSDGGKDYKATMTYPGFSDEDDVIYDFGEVHQGAVPEGTAIFSHYGEVPENPELVAYTGSTDANNISNPNAFEIVDIDNDGITFKFKTSATGLIVGKTYYAQVELTDADAVEAYNNKKIIVKGTVGSPQPEVRIAEEPVVSYGPHTTFSGYVKYTGCLTGDDKVSMVGFVYGKSSIDVDTYKASLPSNHIDLSAAEVAKLNGRTDGVIAAGDLFSKTAYGLEENEVYYYRAYIYTPTAINTRKYFYSEERTFTSRVKCTFSVADTVYYTIDASKEADWCSLRFPSLAAAVEDMKTNETRGHEQWLSTSTNLLSNPVVFEVVAGTYDSGSDPEDCLSSINTTSVSDFVPTGEAAHPLIIRAKDPSKMPVLKGGLDLTRARNIILKDIEITRISSLSRHDGAAVELGVYETFDPSNYTDDDQVNQCTPGAFTDTNIQFIHCKIDATSFNCIHAAACDGLTFDQCEFIMNKPTYAEDDDNDNCRDWGGSLKLMSCKNVQFTRNSLKGSHATTLFLQYVQNMLIMNNVFWNENEYTQNVAFVRPVVLQSYTNAHSKAINPPGKNTNISVYYNTLYLADNAASPYRVNFLRFGCYDNVAGATPSIQQCEKSENYDVANMYFKYNNCYSYDDQISQRSGDDDNGCAFQKITLPLNNFTPNNFWSQGDGSADADSDGKPDIDDPDYKSLLAFPSAATVNTAGGDGTVQHINVKTIVCQSTAENPDDLVVSGDNLNVGSAPSSSSISVLNEAHMTLSDRFDEAARPENGAGWTYGAFQQDVAPDPLHVIYWAGTESDKWDIRGNWRTEDNERLSCVHSFADDLIAIIPDNTPYSPKLPAWGIHTVEPGPEKRASDAATGAARGWYPMEYVEAGRSLSSDPDDDKVTQFANVIDLKHGAAIKGVENLGAYESATSRYDEAKLTLMVPRSQWVLVGSVIKPWDSDGPQPVRGIDFFMDGVPQVYLRDVKINDDNSISWNKSYTSVWTALPADKGFAIRIPDQYGPKRLTAKRYYGEVESENPIWGEDSIKYDFKGRFYNETALPSYSFGTTGVPYPVSNTYPANIDANLLKSYLQSNSKGNLQVYDHEMVSFRSLKAGDLIRSQQTYIITPTVASITIPTEATDPSTGGTRDVFMNGSTKDTYYKSAYLEHPYVSIDAINLYERAGSNIVVKYDELKDNSFSVIYDEFKIFNNMELHLPEVYIMEYDKKLSSVTLPSLEHEIPLGVRILNKMYLRFKLNSQNGMSQAIIEDRDRQTSVDIIDGVTYFTVELDPGTYEGRFFLNLGASDSEEEPIITDVDSSNADSGISIFSAGNEITVSSNSSVNLETMYITNMAGITRELPLRDAHYNRIKLNDVAGVYVVKAVGNIASRTEKVIVK